MSKTQYKYNPRNLSYEKIELSFKARAFKWFSFLVTGFVFAAVILVLSYLFIDSPKEKILKRENTQLQLQYELLYERLSQIATVLDDIQNRDDNIYRVIFEAEPIPDNVRKAGFGGVNRYRDLEGYQNSEKVIEVTKKLDKLAKQLYIQSKSFDNVWQMAKRKEDMMASIPAIQPISNNDLTRVASGYGFRIHPIYKTHKMHYGMDFTAITGTDIYATGSGVVIDVVQSNRGLGNHVVIDHGYGYQTIYAHLSEAKVRKGQKVKRGEVIAAVGNTGTSTAPHLHYEVLKNGEHINPVNYYFNDLTPEEYDRIIEISSTANQSFD